MMLSRLFHIYILCAGVFTTISSEPEIKNILKFLSSAVSLYSSGNTEKTSTNPFDPSYMNFGDFKKENDPLHDRGNCLIDNGLAAVLYECDSSTPYRTSDGSCNNLVFPLWGQAGDCHSRFLQGSYEGISGIRQSVKGGPLPSPRELVLNVFTDVKLPSSNSFLFSVFGQLVAHDLSDTRTQSVTGSCCSQINSKDTSKCAPVFYPKDDPFYSKFNVTCLDIRRSKICPLCLNAKRQQPNDATAPIDGSVIYGVSKQEAIALRTMDGTGMMRGENTSYGELLPSPDKKDKNPKFCPEMKKTTCFKTGDERVNQHSALTAIETSFFREHNRIAQGLAQLNPSWNGETLYQEARKIVGAELQNIVYSEYLPALVGPAHMAYYGLSVQTDRNQNPNDATPSDQYPKSTQYQPIIRLGVWNEFTSAAFRLHSMVPTEVGVDHLRFLDYYRNPGLIRTGQMDKILQGTCQVPSEAMDRWFVDDVSCHFNQKKDSPYGLDLVSTDIQRGRDHGMPPYVDMLKHTTKGRMDVKTFEDLSPIMSVENISLLKNNYKDVRDVDLLAGVILENRVPDSIFGPTACAIISIQFYNVKFGDRFYFEHEKQAPSFTPAQRESLKKSSLSKILCDNTDIQTIQRNSMLVQSAKNDLVDCSKIPSIDLSLWKKTTK